MATKTKDKEEVKDGEVATANELVLASEDGAVAFSDDSFFDGDDGLENVDQSDVTLPRFTVLQGLSPEVNPRKDEYVEGAQIGMVMNTATGRVYEDLPLVVAAYERRNIEWVPRDERSICPIADLPKVHGGGLYKDYGTDDSILEECKLYEENNSLWTPRGHQLVVTGTWYVIDPQTMGRAFIAMGKTQFTSSKKWMAGITDEKISTKDGIRQAPLFYRSWFMGTKMRTHEENEWFVWNHKPGPRLQEYVHGKSILEEVRKFREEILAGSTIIDVSIGEPDQEASGDNAAM